MHKENTGRLLEEGLIPVEFISYGVQDIKFTRVFSFILVKVSRPTHAFATSIKISTFVQTNLIKFNIYSSSLTFTRFRTYFTKWRNISSSGS